MAEAKKTATVELNCPFGREPTIDGVATVSITAYSTKYYRSLKSLP